MKISICSTNDIKGGAAIAAHRLFIGLGQANQNIKMIVLNKYSSNNDIILHQTPSILTNKERQVINSWFRHFYNYDSGYYWNTNIFGSRLYKNPVIKQSDIVNLHWCGDSFVSIKDISKFSQPIVWTFHDLWPLTGGCHMYHLCDRYSLGCGICPLLKSKRLYDLSRFISYLKKWYWRKKNFTIVVPSNWLAKCVRRCSWFDSHRVVVIPNGIDTSIYRPILDARSKLGIAHTKKIVLFVAMGSSRYQRKGLNDFITVLKSIRAKNKNVIGLVVGDIEKDYLAGYDWLTNLGYVSDVDKMVNIYSVADVTCIPSKMDNLPNVIMESMSCATPCVAYDVGGISDIIDHKKNGFLVKAGNVNELAVALASVIGDDNLRTRFARFSRNKILKHYEIKLISKKYLALFNKIISDQYKHHVSFKN